MSSLKTKIITLAFSALVATAAAAGDTPKSAPKPAITMEQARQSALAAVPGGKIKDGEYENEAGQWIFSFDITTAKGIREVWVDPQSGKIVKNEAESKAEQKAENKADEKTETEAQEKAERAKAPKPAVTLAQARKTALAAVPGGSIKSGEYEKEAGGWIYSFDVATAKGIREVWVDPQSGKVIKIETESGKQEKAEAVQDQSAPK